MGDNGSLRVQGEAKRTTRWHYIYVDHLFDMRSTRWHYIYMVPRYIDHLATKYLRALQLRQVDRLLHLVLVAVSLVGGAPFIIMNILAMLLTLIKKSCQPY